MRNIIIAGNWKMYKTQANTLEFIDSFIPLVKDTDPSREIVFCVPYTNLATIASKVQPTSIQIGAQNIHWENEGAFTGEISGSMLTEIGIKYVIVGHSERRQYFGETDETVNLRLKAAQRHGLTPILCVGETKQQRDAGETENVIFAQLAQDLVGVNQDNLVIAYEPIWAIGTGDTCDAVEANRVIGLIRQKMSNKNVTIQYGGSVKPDNVDEIMVQPEIDGALVGGASLDPVGFARIVNYQ